MWEYILPIAILYILLYLTLGLVFTIDSEGLSLWYWEKDVIGIRRPKQILLWRWNKNKK
jgi:hypothetical protein